MRKIIFTGGPGAGKTTLINALEKRGFAVYAESALQIIDEERTRESVDPSYSGVLPWKDPLAFTDRIITRQIAQETHAERGKLWLALFDRSLVDCIAFNRVDNVARPSCIDALVAKAKYEKAFYLTMLPRAAYESIDYHKLPYEHALAVHAALKEEYEASNVQLISVPLLSVDERVEFVLKRL